MKASKLKLIIKAYLTILALSFSQSSFTQKTLQLENTLLHEREIAIELDVPWELTWGPDDNIWLTERSGSIKRINPLTGNTTTVLDFKSSVTNISESGMLGFCFHPEFNTNNLIYVTYDSGPDEYNLVKTISTFEWNGSNLVNENIIISNIPTFRWHSGCRIIISKDNKLLLTIGDAKEQQESQNLNSLLGKLHRFNLDGSIPDDNPIAGSSILSYGHRNSQGLAYGPNDILYATEHGEQTSDELNIIEANNNYGWPNVEGICDTNLENDYCTQNVVTEPIWEWTPCVAVNDIIFYDHEAISEWKGKMLMAVLGGFIQNPSISVITFNEGDRKVIQIDEYFKEYGRIRDICINPNTGSIYFATNGPFYPSFGPNRIIEYYNPDFKTSNNNESIENQFIRVSPNPLLKSDGVNIELSDTFIGSNFELYSMNGKKISSKKALENTLTMASANVPKGSYFIKASNNFGTITKKVIIN